jgi:thiazole synthase
MSNILKQNHYSCGDDPLIIGQRQFHSRLMVGTGKYENYATAQHAIALSGAQIVTMAVRRVELENNIGTIKDYLPADKYTYLPNSAGCYDAEQAVRILRLARQISQDNLVKLEVIGDKKTLLPDMEETVKAAKILVKENFEVMVYCTDQLDYAKQLEDCGCVAIMPLAAPIGTGLGIVNNMALQKLIETIKAPVIVDAGIGTASDATIAMEMGADGVLLNTAIAKAQNPDEMAMAMRYAVIAGRKAFLAGRMEKKNHAEPSSPFAGMVA